MHYNIIGTGTLDHCTLTNIIGSGTVWVKILAGFRTDNVRISTLLMRIVRTKLGGNTPNTFKKEPTLEP